MRKYLFDNTSDMFDLAEYVQTKVYWESSFYLGEESISYKHFWDIARSQYDEQGAIGVIVEDQEITFVYNEVQ